MVKIRKFFALILFLPKAEFSKGIFFSNKIIDSTLIIITIIYIIVNAFIFAISIDSIQTLNETYKDLTQLAFNIVYIIIGLIVIVNGLFPSLKPLNTINNFIYPLSPFEFYIIDIVKATFTFRYICLILYTILLALLSDQFTFNNFIKSLLIIIFCFHGNRSIRTFLLIKINFISLLYLLASFSSIIYFYSEGKYLLIVSVSFLIILISLSYLSFHKLTAKKKQSIGSEKILMRPKKIRFFLWLSITSKNPKIVTTIAFFLLIKIFFIVIFSSRVFSFIFGYKYFLFLSLMPTFVFNYLFNNIFGFTKVTYRNLLTSPFFRANLLKYYFFLFLFLVFVDLNVGLICLNVVSFLKSSSSNVFTSLLGSETQIYSIGNALLMYISFIFFWFPLSMYFSMNFSISIDNKLFTKHNSNFWAALCTIIVAVIFAAIYFLKSDLIIYIFSVLMISVGTILMFIIYRSFEGDRRLLPFEA